MLVNRPTASMREIALASGTGRTTLYRHFPDRQALVRAIFERLINDANDRTRRALAGGGDRDPVEVVADLSVDLAGLGDSYRFLAQDLLRDPRRIDPAETARRRAPLRRYLEAAQQQGRVRTDLAADWLIDAFGSLVTLAAARPQQGLAIPREDLRRTIHSILTTSAAAD